MRKKRSTFSISRATVRAEPGLMKFASRLLSAGEVCIPPPCISHSTRGSDLKGSSRDLPSGPGAKTPCSQSWGPEFNPWSGNQILHAAAKSLHATAKPHAITKDPVQSNKYVLKFFKLFIKMKDPSQEFPHTDFSKVKYTQHLRSNNLVCINVLCKL